MSIIELSKISKHYKDRIVFNNYNLAVENGEFLCITGKSGAGKTTLLNMIGLLEQPDSGDIIICSEKNPRIDSPVGRSLLRYKIAYLFQNYGLIEDKTVGYNISIALKYAQKENKESINDALSQVGLSGYERKYVYQLSGGEQQRVALAKIKVKPCDIILADEPTGSLDSENRDLVLSILKELNRSGKTIIMVSHDKVACNYATRIEKI